MKYRVGKHFSSGAGVELVPFELWGSRDWCNQEVAGESFHLAPLQRLFGRATAKHREVQTIATLVPEPDNKHDPTAVAVRVDGETVGYLPRDVAGGYGPCLAELAARGHVAQVACRVWGGTITDYDTNRAGRLVEKERFTASVTIALAEPHLCTPVNRRPEQPHVMLPDGGAIQISGEDQCMPAIEPLLRVEGEGSVYATLHEVAASGGRAAKDVVEVRLDGQRVGQLTPKMSGELLPAIRHLAELGLVTGAKARLKGNRLKAEVTLYCARAHELPADWPQGVLGDAGAIGVRHEDDVSVVEPPVAVAPEPFVPLSQPAYVVHAPVPPKPTRIRFAPAPGWPAPPDGWEPPVGWQPDPQWPAAPVGWQFWVLA
ncbi:HIRAN domain-containing protein [Kribbella sp. CA-253562]|uniref:HIRAN domain-containing protein n=1 Tax=Kribbella sp. CA-253562 TaxID=3239942 RepID=UPI003D90AE3A